MKIVFGTKDGHAFQKELEKGREAQLIGKKIGEQFDGGIIGLEGYTLKITGGSNKEGTPMRSDITGARKAKALLSGGPGIRSLRKGGRKKKTVAGNTVGAETMQLNAVIATAGAKPIAELGFVPKPKGEKKAEEAAPAAKPKKK